MCVNQNLQAERDSLLLVLERHMCMKSSSRTPPHCFQFQCKLMLHVCKMFTPGFLMVKTLEEWWKVKVSSCVLPVIKTSRHKSRVERKTYLVQYISHDLLRTIVKTSEVICSLCLLWTIVPTREKLCVYSGLMYQQVKCNVFTQD